MDESSELETLKRTALEKVGRNVVNFQRLEAALKYIISHSDICCPTNEVKGHFEENRARVSKQTLGTLVKDFFGNVCQDSPAPELPEEREGAWLASRHRIVSGVPENRKLSLESVVLERNQLIHHDLLKYDFDSADSCRALIEILDQQSLRLKESLTWIMEEARGLAEMHYWLSEFLKMQFAQ